MCIIPYMYMCTLHHQPPPSPTLPPRWPMIPPSFFYGALEFGEGEAWGREYGLAVGCRVQCKGIHLAGQVVILTEHMQHVLTKIVLYDMARQFQMWGVAYTHLHLPASPPPR